LDRFALTINILLKNKFQIYSQSVNQRQTTISTITDKIMNRLGSNYPVTLINSLLTAFSAISVVGIFLNNIFASVIFFLVILCTMLIYSLTLGVKII
jgi:hypothetical protein